MVIDTIEDTEEGTQAENTEVNIEGKKEEALWEIGNIIQETILMKITNQKDKEVTEEVGGIGETEKIEEII